MNENDVAAIAQLFGKPKEEISTAITNGGVSKLVADFTASRKIMTQEDFDKYQENYRQVVINDLVSNKHDLPQAIYEYVKGSVLEKKERDLAKTFGVSDYKGFNDLMDKIVEQSKNRPDEDEIKRLKSKIVEIETEKEKAVSEAIENGNKRFIEAELGKLISDIPIDADGEALENQKEVLLTMFKMRHKINVDGEKIVVMDHDGKPITDSKLDPRPLSEIFNEFAPKYVKLKSPDGGRGDGSTNPKGEISFDDYCIKNNIERNSLAAATAQKELTSRGFKLV